jgi:hypothetical protein
VFDQILSKFSDKPSKWHNFIQHLCIYIQASIHLKTNYGENSPISSHLPDKFILAHLPQTKSKFCLSSRAEADS